MPRQGDGAEKQQPAGSRFRLFESGESKGVEH